MWDQSYQVCADDAYAYAVLGEQLVAKIARGNAQLSHVKAHHIGFYAFDIDPNSGAFAIPFARRFALA